MKLMEFRGLENTVEQQPLAPPISLSQGDMKMCVNVQTSCRPNYLYICLDGIFRNTVFAADSPNVPDVFVNAGLIASGESYADEILKVASHFPVRGVFIDKEHKGIASCCWDSFSRAFDLDYDFCVYIEEDYLITTNALKWLYDVPKIASHYSLYRWQDRMDNEPEFHPPYWYDGDGYTLFRDGRYLSWCAAFSKAGYSFIRELIEANAYSCLTDVDYSEPEVRRLHYADWDKTLILILKQYNLLSMMPPRSLLAHFGSKASQFYGFGRGEHRHEEIFAGDKRHWLDNLVEVFNETTAEEKELLSFRPHSFIYE